MGTVFISWFMILMHVYSISPSLCLESEGIVCFLSVFFFFAHLLMYVVFDESNLICILK